MLDCGHIFCLQCLQDFYNDTIKEGNLSTVRCLAPNCAKERAAAAKTAGEKARKAKTFISPSELLQIGLSEEMVKRYVDLKYKTELESDKNTIYCPRQWCNGAARSKKHKKPSGLDFGETSDAESDQDEKKGSDKFNPGDLLCVCEDCGFAFCSRCFQSWHGEFFHCAPRRQNGELTEDEKASLEYLKLHTSPCPTCNAPAQKTHGCNHMICSRCDTHFCYLCSSWLDPGNPYRHYNQQDDGKVTSCYMRLWELEGGDGDDVGLGFVGGRGAAVNDNANGAAPEDEEALDWVGIDVEEVDDDVEVNANANANANAPVQLDENGQRVAVAREAPLVLRLVDNAVNNGNGNNNNNDNNPGRGGQRAADNLQPARPRGGAGAAAGGGRGRPAAHAPNHRAGQAANNNARGHPVNRGRGARGDGRRGHDGGRGGARRREGGAAGRGGAARGEPQAAAAAAAAAAGRHDPNNNNNENNEDVLDAAQEAWIRHFVQMALMDVEDQVEGGDSDEDGDNWLIR